MPVLTKVGSITGGLYTNPNTFTRNLSLAYDALGLQINTITEILGSTQRSPVSEILDNRWTYPVSPVNHGTTINPATSGLDGTSIFTYAGSDYGLIDPTFLIENPDNVSLKRPSTIYEAFVKLKLYTDKAIAERSAAIISMVTGSEINLTGAEEGAVLQNTAGEVSASTWRFMVDGTDFILRAPGGNYFVSNATQIKLDAPEIKFVTNYLTLTDVDTVPSGALNGVGRIYYSTEDSSLHLVDHTGVDSALGSGGGGGGSGYSELIEEEIHQTAAGPYSWTIGDVSTLNKYTCVVFADMACDITLPDSMNGPVEIIISDGNGTADSFPISIYANGGQEIKGGGAGPAVIIDTSYGCVSLKWVDGTNYWIILYGR